jgi:predicted nucleic acid-binding Zn ribbon protein
MLAKLDNMGFDAIALIRGGGKYLEELNSRIVIKACAALSTPLLVAAGHFVDNPLIQHIASKVCGTPTMLGVYLAEMSERSYSYNQQESVCSENKTDMMNIKKKNNRFTYFLWFFYTILCGYPLAITLFNYVKDPLKVFGILFAIVVFGFIAYHTVNYLYIKSYAYAEWDYANRKLYMQKKPFWDFVQDVPWNFRVGRK